MNITGSTINFPFRADARGTLAATTNRSELIEQAIQDVLETRQGERVMLPDYGIPDFVFDSIDAGFAARLAYFLEEQVKRYVPLVADIQIEQATDDNNRAIIELQYTEVNAINSPKNLTFPVWQYVGN